MSDKDKKASANSEGENGGLRGFRKVMSKVFRPKEDKLAKALEPISSIQACKDAALTAEDDDKLLAICKLGDFGSDALESLDIALSDESSMIRIAAVGVIAAIGDVSSVETLTEYLADEEEAVRNIVEYSMGWLDKHGKIRGIEDMLRPPSTRKAEAILLESTPIRTSDDVSVNTDFSTTRGEMEFSLSVTNGSDSPLSDVTIALLSYPTDSIILLDDPTRKVSRIKVGETYEIVYRFSIDKECIEGEFISSVTFFDKEGELIAAKAGNRFIRSFFDQLDPLEITVDEFLDMKQSLFEWSREHTIEASSDNVVQFLVDYITKINFYPYHFDSSKKKDVCMGVVAGMARGRFSGIKVGLTATSVGEENKNLSKLRIDVYSDDSEVLQAAASELFERVQLDFINNIE